MEPYPQYEDDGSERLSHENIWRNIEPQEILGADCFIPIVDLQDVGNIITLELSADQFREMFSALYNGAEITYPDRYLQILVNFLKGLHCPPEVENEDGCLNFYPSASFVEFTPQNPYNEPDFIPDDYIVPPFFVNGEEEYPLEFGYKTTDVFVDPASINIDPIDLITLNLPTIKISVFGSGQIELDLLAVALGSQVIIKVGSPPNIFDIVVDGITEDVTIIDLNVDSLSVPPETDIVYTEEINIEAAAGERTDVYLVFVPNLDDSLIPLRYGGGIRNIGLCGFEQEGVSGVEDVRFNTENCTFEKRVLGEWMPIENGDEWLACVEELMATQEEIRQAIIEASEEIAARFLSGEAGNVVGSVLVNPDGSTEVVGGSVGDDPETWYDDAAAAVMGGTLAVSSAINRFLDDVDGYYGSVNGSEVNTVETAQFAIKLYYPCDAATMDAAIANYYLWRETNNRILFDNTTNFGLFMYCHGANERGFAQWLIDDSGYSLEKQSVVHLLVTGLSEEFWNIYYNKGLSIPSTSYLDAPCVPIATQILEAMVFDVSRSTTPLKANHRMKFTAEGYALDADGDIQDWFWYRTLAGINTFTAPTFTHSAGSNLPSQNQVPYRSDHRYEWTIDLGNLNAAMVIEINRNANIALAGLTYPEEFKITIEDLGEVTI